MGNLDLKTERSQQASWTWTNMWDFFTLKCLNKDIKKGRADPFFQFSVLPYPCLRTFHKSSDTFPHFTPKPWVPSCPRSNSRTLGAATSPSTPLLQHLSIVSSFLHCDSSTYHTHLVLYTIHTAILRNISFIHLCVKFLDANVFCKATQMCSARRTK